MISPDFILHNIAGVYKLENVVTGEFYIGSTTNLGNRLSVHRYQMKKSTHGNRNIQALHDEHGIDAFSFEVIKVVSEKSQLIAEEQHYIDQMKPSLNIAPHAGTFRGVKHTDKARAKMSESRKGDKNCWFGKIPPCATMPRTAEMRRNLSEKHSGRGNPMFGVTPAHAKFTDEQVREIRNSILVGDSLATIAKRYGVSKGTIAHIRQGRSYQGVT